MAAHPCTLLGLCVLRRVASRCVQMQATGTGWSIVRFSIGFIGILTPQPALQSMRNFFIMEISAEEAAPILFLLRTTDIMRSLYSKGRTEEVGRG